MMKTLIPLIVAFSCGVTAAAAGQAAVSPHSLAGDWEYVVTPSQKLVLHLHVSPSGAITGTVDVSGPQPKRIELRNVQLAGIMLTYTMPPLAGTFREVVMPGARQMVGPHVWVKEGTVGLPPPFEPLSQVAGDWKWPGDGPLTQVLRLRLDARGALTGAIDIPEPMAQRMPLQNVYVSGRTLSYMTADGRTYEGAFSKGGTTLKPTPLSMIDATWEHLRTAAQAAASDAAGTANPANGDWTGAGNYTASFPGIGPRQGTMKLSFHFHSNPASCSVKLEGSSDSAVPCVMRRTGNRVRLGAIGYSATFDGALSADGTHLKGAWMMGSVWHWTGPMQIDLTRTSPAK